MKKRCSVFILLLVGYISYGQGKAQRVLFVGNSYVSVNNLPQMVANIAASMNDTLIFDSNAPGGFTLKNHSSNAATLTKISNGSWDFVVLQEQSQYPSFPLGQVQSEVFPYARLLDSLIHLQNPCAETMFYMTWGRKNGDANNCAFWPPVCTYQGMDSLLNLRYRIMAQDNHATISPVGAVWNYIRKNFPNIELYQSDESHPSVAGTYAAACCFYTSIFRKDPMAIPFNPSLSAIDAENIKSTVKKIVFDDLREWHIGEYDPVADFSFSIIEGNTVSFVNNSSNASEYLWDFGDGTYTDLFDPVHQFSSPGTYRVNLVVSRCSKSDTVSAIVNIASSAILTGYIILEISVYPNPTSTTLHIKGALGSGLSYRIFSSSGRMVASGSLNLPESGIHIDDLLSGFYIIQLYDGRGTNCFARFVKI